jgi:hypothetical protein
VELQQLGLQLGRLGGDGDVGRELRGRGGREVGRGQGLRGEVAGGAVVLLEGVEGGLDGLGRMCRSGPPEG